MVNYRCSSLSTKLAGNILDTINIFNIPLVKARVAVVYFTALSCLYIVSNFLRLPEPNENMLQRLYLSSYLPPVPNSAKQPHKRANSVAQNFVFCGKLWSLVISVSGGSSCE